MDNLGLIRAIPEIRPPQQMSDAAIDSSLRRAPQFLRFWSGWSRVSPAIKC